MGAMFIGQQFLQNVLGYSTLQAGLAILPAAICMVLVAPRSAKIVDARGARFTLLAGYAFCLLGFLTMLLLWKEDIAYWKVGLGYAFMGIGVGLAGTPASHSLTGSVPVTARRHGLGHRRPATRPRRSDHAVDLRRAAHRRLRRRRRRSDHAPPASNVSDSVQNQLTKSFAGADAIAQQYPPSVQDTIVAAAKTSFLHGDQWAYLAGIVAVLVGGAVVFSFFPRKRREERLLAEYHSLDAARTSAEPPELVPVPAGQ